ncbi:MAG TPA: FIST N-terminal domain-containing protein, partial [Labilithrix sp.]|nr:FIST N-terminal domain-containing protein [Labilithrix sp.]
MMVERAGGTLPETTGMVLASFGPIEGEPSRLGAAISVTLAELEGTGKLVVVYLPIRSRVELRAFLAAASRASRGVPIIGATTGGAAFTDRGLTRRGIVGAVLGGDVSVRTADARNLRADGAAGLGRSLESLDIDHAHSPCLFTLMDAYAADGEALVTALRDHTPVDCRCFGGTAGDGGLFERTYVFHDGEVLTDAAVFALIETPTKLAIDVLHGWEVAPEGRPMTITVIDGRVLRTLDGRPAAAVYVDELRRLGLFGPGEELVGALFRSEIGVCTPFGEHLKIRA